jgi:hypothetical protein
MRDAFERERRRQAAEDSERGGSAAAYEHFLAAASAYGIRNGREVSRFLAAMAAHSNPGTRMVLLPPPADGDRDRATVPDGWLVAPAPKRAGVRDYRRGAGVVLLSSGETVWTEDGDERVTPPTIWRGPPTSVAERVPSHEDFLAGLGRLLAFHNITDWFDDAKPYRAPPTANEQAARLQREIDRLQARRAEITAELTKVRYRNDWLLWRRRKRTLQDEQRTAVLRMSELQHELSELRRRA